MERQIDRLEGENRLLILGLGAVVLAGVVMRLAALGEHPYGLYQDEAVNGLDALNVLAGARPLYFEANNGREPLFIYLVASMVGLFGRTPLGIRAAAAVVGVATLPAVFLLGRAWGGSRLGWISAGLLATMLWHVHLSRVGFRAVTLPLFMALGLACGALALKRQSRRWAIAAGAAYGTGFYTYLAVRFTPLALFLMLAYAATWHRAWLRERWRLILWMAVAAGLVVLPLAILAMAQPDIVLGRSAQVAIWNRADFPEILLGNIVRTLGMFNWRGDWIWRHNVPNRPVFDALIGLAFLAGVILGVRRWQARPALAVSLIWIGVMLLPTMLADDAPHFLRAVGVLPVAVILPAAALEGGATWIARRWGGRWAASALIAVLLLSAALTANDTFGCSGSLPVRLSGFDYQGCYRTDPVRGYFFQAEATTLARDANGVQGSLYLDRRYMESFPSVRFLLAKQDVTLYEEGERLSAHAPPVSLIAWPHQGLENALSVLPQPSQIEVAPGPETRGDQETAPYQLYIRYTATAWPDREHSEPLARYETGIDLLDLKIRQEADGLLIALSWRAERRVAKPVQSFIHLVEGPGSASLAQVDETPGTIYYPPLSWNPGSVIIHAVRLRVILLGEGSSLQILVGLYDPTTGNRIPILSSSLEQRDGALILPLPGGGAP